MSAREWFEALRESIEPQDYLWWFVLIAALLLLPGDHGCQIRIEIDDEPLIERPTAPEEDEAR